MTIWEECRYFNSFLLLFLLFSFCLLSFSLSFRIGRCNLLFYFICIKLCVVSLPILILYYLLSPRLTVCFACKPCTVLALARACLHSKTELTDDDDNDDDNNNGCTTISFSFEFRSIYSADHERSPITIKIAAQLLQHCQPWFFVFIFHPISVSGRIVTGTQHVEKTWNLRIYV